MPVINKVEQELAYKKFPPLHQRSTRSSLYELRVGVLLIFYMLFGELGVRS